MGTRSRSASSYAVAPVSDRTRRVRTMRAGTFIALFTSACILGPDVAAQQYPEAVIPETHLRSVRSTVLDGKEYQISIALPYGYSESDETYPVLFVLDANGQFGTVTETVRALGLIEQSIPQVIVVGIGYPVGVYWNAIALRSVDLTPTKDAAWEADTRVSWPPRFPRPVGSGGGPEFLRFIDEELIPFVEQEYRASPDDRAIYGFSQGGLFVLYALFHRPSLFQRYIAGSPSLWWDSEVTFRFEEAFSRGNSSLPVRLFLSVGTDERRERMVEPLRRFVEQLEQRSYDGLDLRVHYFEGETHDSAVPGTISRGLRAVFDPPNRGG